MFGEERDDDEEEEEHEDNEGFLAVFLTDFLGI
jgi:hypothetical protein